MSGLDIMNQVHTKEGLGVGFAGVIHSVTPLGGTHVGRIVRGLSWCKGAGSPGGLVDGPELRESGDRGRVARAGPEEGFGERFPRDVYGVEEAAAAAAAGAAEVDAPLCLEEAPDSRRRERRVIGGDRTPDSSERMEDSWQHVSGREDGPSSGGSSSIRTVESRGVGGGEDEKGDRASRAHWLKNCRR